MVTAVVVLATLVALVLVVMGFVAAFRESTMRLPWVYWTWAIVAVLVMSMLIGLPVWIRAVNFVILLASAYMWVHDSKEAVNE